jgi:hypothetical protein
MTNSKARREDFMRTFERWRERDRGKTPERDSVGACCAEDRITLR